MQSPPERIHGSAFDAFVALGANLGPRLTTLQRAVAQLHQPSATTVVRASSVYESRALPRGPDAFSGGEGPCDPPFLNAVIHIRTTATPLALLRRLLHLEVVHGRVRDAPWGPRVLDLDLIDHAMHSMIAGDQFSTTGGSSAAPDDDLRLELPHPRAHLRDFVLVPLLELGFCNHLAGSPPRRWLERLPVHARTIGRVIAGPDALDPVVSSPAHTHNVA